MIDSSKDEVIKSQIKSNNKEEIDTTENTAQEAEKRVLMLDQEKEEKEAKRKNNDELLFLKISATALILILKRISDRVFQISSSTSELCEAGNDFFITLLKVKLQLLLFPLVVPPSSKSGPGPDLCPDLGPGPNPLYCFGPGSDSGFGSSSDSIHSEVMSSLASTDNHEQKNSYRGKDGENLASEMEMEKKMRSKDIFSGIFLFGRVEDFSSNDSQGDHSPWWIGSASSSTTTTKTAAAATTALCGTSTGANINCYPPQLPPSSTSPSPSPLSSSYFSVHWILNNLVKSLSHNPLTNSTSPASATAINRTVSPICQTSTLSVDSSISKKGVDVVFDLNFKKEISTDDPVTSIDDQLGLKEILRVLIASQQALSYLLNIINIKPYKTFKSQVDNDKNFPFVTPSSPKYYHRDRNDSLSISDINPIPNVMFKSNSNSTFKLKLKLKPNATKNIRQSPDKGIQIIKENDTSNEEKLWISLLTLCGHLQCNACTYAFLFSPPFLFSQAFYTSTYTQKYISLSSSSMISLLLDISYDRLLAFKSYSRNCIEEKNKKKTKKNCETKAEGREKVKVKVGGERETEEASEGENEEEEEEEGIQDDRISSDQYDRHIGDEIWALLMNIVRDLGPTVPQDFKLKDANFIGESSILKLDSVTYGLGQVLLQWVRCGIPIIDFEKRILDLCFYNGKVSSNNSLGKNLIFILKLLLFTWRQRTKKIISPPHVCVVEDRMKNVQESHKLDKDRDGNVCFSNKNFSFNPTSPENIVWLRKVHAIVFSTHFLLSITSLK